MKTNRNKPDKPLGTPLLKGAFLRICLLLLAVMAIGKMQAAETFSLSVNKVPFATAVKTIEAKTDYTFVYDTGVVDSDAVVTFRVRNASISTIVRNLIKGQNLKFEVRKKRVFLTRGNSANDAGKVENGKKLITGKVTDGNGEPLIGATVSQKDADVYAATDVDGNFSISIPLQYADKKIHVSYVGFEPMVVSIKDKDYIDISMESSSQVLQDVVVVGYGTKKKESLTSAISTVAAEDISRSAATTTSGALVGKVAGINSRMSDGRPGAATTLNIRNMGTPLYVVDGVQMDEGQFNNIDFNDIENISVLKDASASIYGVRAANGVVVVTTKSGKRNMPNEVNLNAYVGFQEMFRFPRPASATDWIGAWINSANIKRESPKYTREEYEAYKKDPKHEKLGWDWYDYTFKKAPQYYLSASTQGGSDKINYYFAVGHTRQDAIIRNFGNFNRTNMQVNVNANITDNFKLGASINGRLENRDHPAVSANDGNDDYWSAFFSIYRNLPTNRPYANDNPDYPNMTSTAKYNNTALLGKTGEYKERWKVLQSTFNAEWEIIKGLKLKGILSYYYANGWSDNFEKSFKLYTWDGKNYNVAQDVTQIYRFRSESNYSDLNTQVSLSYDTKINGMHHISAFVGSETYKRDTPGWQLSSNPMTNSMKKIYFDDITGYNDVGDNTQARAGFMGRVNYEYGTRYLFEFAARYDGSWKFPPKHRWGFFPSVSGGWRISEESFWNDDLKDIFSNLKVRASYGIAGDDNVWSYSAFDYLSGYNYGSGGAVLDGGWVSGSSARNMPVTNFSWIKAKIADVGIDVGFFNNQLTGTFDLFRRMRTNLPASRYDKLLPSEVGFTLPVENLNSDMQKGLDWSLMWQSKVGDFSYRVGGNFTFARAYNWHQYKPLFSNSRDYYVYSSNERVWGSAWALDCIGQFQSWEEIANYPVDIDGKGNSTLRPGDLIYADTNGDGQITGEDQKPVAYQSYESGNTPLINFGLTLGFEWKGIDFAADFTGGAKQSFWFNYEQRTPFWGEGAIPDYMVQDSWHLADIFNPDSELVPGTFPSLLSGNQTHSNYTASTFWMRNVRYMKLRNLEIGYTFPVKWTKKAAIKRLRVYTLMQNLFSIDNVHDRDIDPEIAQAAGFAYPTNRVINFGVNVTF